MVIFFHGATGDERLRATFDGAGVDTDVFDPVEIQRDARIGLEGATAKMGDGGVGRRNGSGRCGDMRGVGGARRFGYVRHVGSFSGKECFTREYKSYHFDDNFLQN